MDWLREEKKKESCLMGNYRCVKEKQSPDFIPDFLSTPDRPLHWTKTAIQCYEQKCNCQICSIPDKLETLINPLEENTKTKKQTPCKVKYAVVELLKRSGSPEYINFANNVVNKVKRILGK